MFWGFLFLNLKFQIAPFHYVKKTKHYDASKWPLSAAAAANPTAATAANSPQVILSQNLHSFRLSAQDHNSTLGKPHGAYPKNERRPSSIFV
jgi:hypothetical protein